MARETFMGLRTHHIVVALIALLPKHTMVPPVAGLSETKAKQAIAQAGLTVTAVARESSDTIPSGDAVTLADVCEGRVLGRGDPPPRDGSAAVAAQ